MTWEIHDFVTIILAAILPLGGIFVVFRMVRDELARGRQENNLAISSFRDEVSRRLDTLSQQANDEAKQSRSELRDVNDRFRMAVEAQLHRISADNGAKLEEIRRTVSEKLEGTLDRRLGDSFKMVSDRLEQVYKGLGEMQTLAVGVGDLKKVMSNVKVRGTWGEIQLGNLLEQILSPEQYGCNVQTKRGSNGRVEFAIKMPGRDPGSEASIWMPIDAKFPLENYERLVDAQEKADALAADVETKALEAYIKMSAREISEKYVSPPETTDFAVMYLPTEGLFAEVVRRAGLVEHIQREHRVIIAGPTTLAALLNSLQMGFRTLAIQKRSGEVWKVLGAVKSEFGKFEDVLKKVEKKLQEAGNVIDSASQRSRVISRRLKDVQALPNDGAEELFAAGDLDENSLEMSGE